MKMIKTSILNFQIIFIGCMKFYTYGYYGYINNKYDAPEEHHIH